ncbi:MAG: hypothetical protein ACRC1M_07950 [Methanobacteriaceae archaeon]
MICQKCKAENNDKNKFCKKCGTSISSKEVSKSQISQISQENSDTRISIKKSNILIGLVIMLLVVVIILGVFAIGVFNNDSNSSSNGTIPKKSTNGSGNSGLGSQYTYLDNVPFNIPPYYTYTNNSQGNNVYSENYLNNRGEKLTIRVAYGTSANQLSLSMVNEGWNYRFDRSRNLYYLSHHNANSYIYERNGVTVYIYADNLDDLHIVYVP